MRKHVQWKAAESHSSCASGVQTVDFGRVQFDVIVVEADRTDPVKEQQIVDLLADKGYTFRGYRQRNNWFMRKGFMPSQRPRSAH